MRRFFCSILFLLISVASLSGYSQSNQKSFGIAYFEPGSYYLFDVFSNELTDNLEEMGGDSMNIAYLPDARFSANWDRNLCKAMANDLVKAKNVDLVIAAGPWVIEDLLAAGFKKPIVGICQFDPESMGLIDSTGKTLFSNVTVNYSPRKIKSDIAALKKLFPSRKIGMLYFPSGKEFDRVKGKISKAAGDTGTAVVSAQIYTRQDLYSFSFSFEKIKKEARVLYLAPLWGMDLNAIREFFTETQKARIPTFDAEGFLLLEKGATAANCYRPYHSMVKFTALKVMKILGGTEPSSLHTGFEEFPELCLNLDAAQKIGLTFPRKMINDAKLIPVPPGDTASVYTLAQALDQAAKENSGYLAMGQTYERAVAEARHGYLSYYPQVDIGISSATTNDGALASRYEKLLNRKFQADINVEQILFSYPALKSIHIAKKNMTMKRVNLKQAALDLKQAVTGAYITVLEKEDKVAAQNGMIDWLRDLRDYVETNSRLGLGGKNDLPFIELQLAQAKIGLYNLQNEIKISRIIFNVLINRPADYEFVLDRKEFNPEIMAAMVRKFDEYISDTKIQRKLEQYLIEEGIKNSADMEMADLSIGIQQDMISRHKGRYFPELSLRAGHSYGTEWGTSLSERNNYWILGGMLRFPLFPGNDKGYNRQALSAEMDHLAYEKDNIRLARMEGILIKLDNLIARMTTLPLNYFSKNLSRANLDTARSRYYDGVYSINDLIETEENSSLLALNTIEDMYQFYTVYSELLGEVGIGYMLHGSSEEEYFYKNLEDYLKR